MNHIQHCDALASEASLFASDVASADLSMPVVTCPPWTLADLLQHLGSIHRWSAQMVRELTPERLSFKKVDLAMPADKKDLPDWFKAGAQELATTLRAADPEAPMWAWGEDKHVRFWSPRQLHETAVHRADAELALGREPVIEAGIAIDGIDELLQDLPHAAYFSPTVTKLRGSGESLHFHSTDAEGEWMVRLEPDGFTWEHGHDKGSVAIRGAASDLLLLLSGRRRPDDSRFQRFGDDAVLAFWLENARL